MYGFIYLIERFPALAPKRVPAAVAAAAAAAIGGYGQIVVSFIRCA